MSMPSFTRSALVAGLVAASLASPALARGKTNTVTVPASVMKDATSRVCMPSSMAKDAERGGPATLCQTRDEWAASGVTIVTK